MRQAGVWIPGTIWALHCWQNSLRDISADYLHIWQTFLRFFFFPVVLFSQRIREPSSICVECLGVCSRGFLQLSFYFHLEMTPITRSAVGRNPMGILPSWSSMLLILFSEGKRILGGLSVNGAGRRKKAPFINGTRESRNTNKLFFSDELFLNELFSVSCIHPSVHPSILFLPPSQIRVTGQLS